MSITKALLILCLVSLLSACSFKVKPVGEEQKRELLKMLDEQEKPNPLWLYLFPWEYEDTE